MKALMTELGLGGNIFGHFTDARETKRIMDVAFDLGVRMVDTAGIYSDGLSELHIGSAIQNNREAWTVATKFETDEDPRIAVEASLKRLQTEYIDLYQAHHPVSLKTCELLEQLRQQGIIRSWGVCNYTADQLCELTREHKPSFVQIPYNYLSKSPTSAMKIAASHQVGVIAYHVLGRGVLTNKYSDNIPVGSRAESSLNVRADIIEEPPGLETALKFVTSTPNIKVALVGVRNTDQLIEITKNIRE